MPLHSLLALLNKLGYQADQSYANAIRFTNKANTKRALLTVITYEVFSHEKLKYSGGKLVDAVQAYNRAKPKNDQ